MAIANSTAPSSPLDSKLIARIRNFIVITSSSISSGGQVAKIRIAPHMLVVTSPVRQPALEESVQLSVITDALDQESMVIRLVCQANPARFSISRAEATHHSLRITHNSRITLLFQYS
jgi:hypothetical protein